MGEEGRKCGRGEDTPESEHPRPERVPEKQNRSWLKDWLPVAVSLFAAIAAGASAITAIRQAQYAKDQLELARAKFSEVELPAALAGVRSLVKLELDSSSLRVGQPLHRANFVVTLQNGSGEDILDLFLSLRLRAQHRETGDSEEREIASHFESAIYSGPIALKFDLGDPARTILRQSMKSLLLSHVPRSIVLHAEWRLRAGHRLEITRGYPVGERKQ